VFNSTPNGSRGGIGESGAAPASDGNGNIFVATSDGTFDANTSGNDDYAESLLRLDTNSGFAVADRFTPPIPGIQLLGTDGVLLLPAGAGSVAHPNLAVAGSQAGNLYLLDRDNLKGGALQALCLSMPITGTPTYWAASKTIYVAAAGGTLQAFPLANGSFSSALCPSPATPSSQSPEVFNTHGASPVISSNGISNGIVWALDDSGYAGAGGVSSPAILHAYDATNLANELYMSPASWTGAAGLAVKFAVPTVANGTVYVGTQNELSVFGLLP
jgi:outer membrane protein assembly factor BamB